ncbi:hypothetical protein [Paenibacillus sp. J2TS4]|uniref:hypothetical protein n=1 Tax=Paenibacillus sp. J2TS4 TaxID=2807194 RepID=UPI001B2424C6|nr:hypothetical protein [Paenibacillus sp. J2TS4]GIP35945.1 hypothetical protein J2TS4_51550 [Paenibacillus sp. J2TS4]
MVHINSFVSNTVISTSIVNDIVSSIKGLGYRLPIEEAKINYIEALGFACPNFETEDLIERRFLYDLNYLYGLNSNLNVNWSAFIKLSNDRDFCIFKVVEEVHDVETRRSKTKRSVKLELTFLTLSDSGEECDKILKGLKEKGIGITEWTKVIIRSSKFDELSQKYASPVFSENDYVIAKKLNDSKLLNI